MVKGYDRAVSSKTDCLVTGPSRQSAEEDGRSYPDHQNNMSCTNIFVDKITGYNLGILYGTQTDAHQFFAFITGLIHFNDAFKRWLGSDDFCCAVSRRLDVGCGDFMSQVWSASDISTYSLQTCSECRR